MRELDLCKHFGKCGGCALQDVPYSQQLQLKRELILKQAKKRGVNLPPFSLRPSPREFYYRNKIEMSFFPLDGGNIALGFHPRGNNREIIDLEECRLYDEFLETFLPKMKEFAQGTGLPAYDKYKHTGFFRYVVLRKNRAGDMLLALVVSSQGELDTDSFIRFASEFEEIKGVFLIIHDGLGDAVGFGQVRHLSGITEIEEIVESVRFLIGLKTFFQVNPYAVDILYSIAVDFVKEHISSGKILDLYSGSGGIGLVLAKQGYTVLGVELNEQACRDAQLNAEMNGIKSYSIVQGNVRAVLGVKKDWIDKFDLVLVDPPRSGLVPKVRDRIERLNTKYLLYVSCNPITFMEDVNVFSRTYEIIAFESVDMFPHTPHIETVALLERR